MQNNNRLDAEWVTLNAVRGMVKIAANGDLAKATYDNALEFGGELYPALLGADSSILRRERESDTVKEYRQKAQLKSIKQAKEVTALTLLQADIAELKDLLEISRSNKKERAKTDQLKRRLAIFVSAEVELNPVPHSENQLIFRDALSVERTVPPLRSGKSFRDFELPDSSILRIRVLHPDKPEHVTGADIIYERHLPSEDKASIVVVQYKIWEDKTMLMTDPRMLGQIDRLRAFTCEDQVCEPDDTTNPFRFPCCAAFLRPTDKLQRPDQSFMSTGEHIPLCRISDACSKSTRGKPQLEYKKMRDISLSSEMFEQLFNKGKIGSRYLTYSELTDIYTQNAIAEDENTVIIYAQEFSDIE
ncbi:hypothetical protein KDM87_01865 [Undibacterium sp. FT147W]|uniref:Uncharacterized protein n=1 Tax=Undibacterium rivi TaxID=2828729 RepID=A0ABS5GYV4_9BURK|nr:hypothetical protein [Undibacterium rivi]MBR7791329.1 hypothetical protein [Undibacterium rivi]